MDRNEYRIRKALIIPLAIDTILLFLLLFISIATKRATIEIAFFTFFTVLAAYLFMESIFRRVSIGSKTIIIKKLFAIREFPWENVTHVEGLIIKNKTYILLTTTVGFFIISNVYNRFTALLENIASHIDSSRLETEALSMIAHPSSVKTTVALLWVSAVLLTGIAALKIYPFIQ